MSEKMLELVIVMDSMELEVEKEGPELLELVELDTTDSTDKDSGLDSSEENYMDIEIFA